MKDYGEYITGVVQGLPNGKIFGTEMVANMVADEYGLAINHAKAITNNQLKRLTDAGKLDRIQKGVYYKAKNTVFGKVRPNLDEYAIQALTMQGEEIIGYVTGAAFMNRIGLTTLIPREIEIISNQYRKVLPDGCHVTAKKPVVQINAENYEYLQLLDAIENLSVIHVDAENPEDLIRAAARERKTKPIELIFYARQFYPVKTLLRTVDIFAGVNK